MPYILPQTAIPCHILPLLCPFAGKPARSHPLTMKPISRKIHWVNATALQIANRMGGLVWLLSTAPTFTLELPVRDR